MWSSWSKGRKRCWLRRKGSHGAGTYALPGGHLEFGEQLDECAEREVLEETGLVVRDTKFEWLENSIFGEGEAVKHYVTVFMRATLADLVSLFLRKARFCRKAHLATGTALLYCMANLGSVWLAGSRAAPFGAGEVRGLALGEMAANTEASLCTTSTAARWRVRPLQE